MACLSAAIPAFSQRLSTEPCSKPLICTEHSLFGVSSFGVHTQILWVEGPATLNWFQKGKASPVQSTDFLPGTSL